MTDYTKVNPQKEGWLNVARATIDAGKPLQIYMDQKMFMEIIKAVYERAEENPFKDIVAKVTAIPGVPPEVTGLVVKVLPMMSAVAAVGGGPLGAMLSIGGVVGYAALHGYRVEAGVDWNVLFDFTDDEAFIRLDPKA